MSKPTYLMLAHNWTGQDVRGWFCSRKLDGQRAFWDGGVSWGKPVRDIPWANTAKEDRYTTPTICTGLWTRQGHPIQAPTSFINTLPERVCLDGELWLGVKGFQSLRKIVADRTPDERAWREVRYMVFDSPVYRLFFDGRTIRETSFKAKLPDAAWFADWLDVPLLGRPAPFHSTFAFLQYTLPIGNGEQPGVQTLQQHLIPIHSDEVQPYIQERLDHETSLGGEGLMLRNPNSMWTPERTYNLLKVKPEHTATATVIGYTAGSGTSADKTVSGLPGSKLVGLMGALRLALPSGQVFQLSGFTEAERRLTGPEPATTTWLHDPANWSQVCPVWITSPQFPRGSQVQFKYRELSDDGIPKEARYCRA